MRNRRLLTVLLVAATCLAGRAQTDADSLGRAVLADDFIQSSLLIIGPSNELYTGYGHAALRMELSSSVAPGARRRPPAAAALPLAPGATWIPAPVLSRSGTVGVSGIMRLGKGSLAGVKAGAPVAAPEGLVGRVLAVTPHTCDVRLIIDPSMRVSCEIEPPDPSDGPIYGILYGGGAACVAAEADASILYVVNPLRMRHMQRRLDLPPRSKIITSGLGGIFPRGLVVGFLLDGQHIDETRLEREGDVVAAVDFPALENVFIRRED